MDDDDDDDGDMTPRLVSSCNNLLCILIFKEAWESETMMNPSLRRA